MYHMHCTSTFEGPFEQFLNHHEGEEDRLLPHLPHRADAFAEHLRIQGHEASDLARQQLADVEPRSPYRTMASAAFPIDFCCLPPWKAAFSQGIERIL